MKKITALVAVVLSLLMVFTACGKKEPAETSPEESTPVESQPAEESAETPAGETGKAEGYGTTLEDVKEKGSLIMGLDDTFAPMGFRDPDGSLVGFDIDLANAVGENLGVDIVFQQVNWDSKELELQSGSIDCIWNGFSLTPDRERELTMSKPYLANKIVVMTNEGVEVTSKEDLAELNIGIQAGSAALEAVQRDDIYDSIADKIVEYPTYDEVILDMKTGRLDCMIIDQVFGEYKNTQLGGIYGTSSVDFGEDLYAIGFRKGDTNLADAVNGAIAELVADGTAEEISIDWFGKDIVLAQ